MASINELNEKFMQHALEVAKKGQGFCAPNPAVGAVLVRQGIVIAEGFHRGSGLSHAEVEVLAVCQDADISDCDLYVTLEPCCHYGRTPPCTDLIIRKQLSHVYFGYVDPNPVVSGQGQQLLREAGIACEFIASKAVHDFYKPYQFWWQYKRPYVTLKLAVTEDRRVAIGPITGKACQLYTHQQRLMHDALLATANTIIHDNPQYNARLIDAAVKKPLYVLDSDARLPLNARVLDSCAPVTVFHAGDADQKRLTLLEQKGVRCVAVPRLRDGLDLSVCLEKIGADGKHALWVEAGFGCFQSFVKSGFSEGIIFYIAPKTEGPTNSFHFIYEQGQEREIECVAMHDDMMIVLKV